VQVGRLSKKCKLGRWKCSVVERKKKKEKVTMSKESVLYFWIIKCKEKQRANCQQLFIPFIVICC
jgi:hypothetical protein